MTQIKITPEQLELLQMGTVINTAHGNTYYYFPFWIKKSEAGEFFMISSEHMPQELDQILKDLRNETH